jgi:hypothetical protein
MVENENDMTHVIFWEDDNTFSDEFETRDEAKAFLAESDRPGHYVAYLEGEREAALDMCLEYNHPLFKRGLSLGEALGHSQAVEEATKAHKMGELKLWLKAMKPKSIKGWRKWEAKYGEDFSDRWKRKDSDALG